MIGLKKIKLNFHRRLSGYVHRIQLIRVPIPPVEIFIETTNFCNLRCPMCPQSYGLNRPKGFMDFQTYKNIVDQVKGRISEISLFLAGESLLHKDIFEMISYANKAGLYTRLHTNAVLLTEKKADELLDCGSDELSFSFDGPTKERYDAVRVGGDFEKAIRNIKYFLESKKQKELALPYTIIQVLLFEGDNESFIRKGTDDLFNGYKFDKIKIIESHSWAGTFDGYIRYKDRLERNYYPCSLIYNRISVTWDGKVVGCCNDLQARYICGDIREEPILKIWNNKRYRYLRKILVSKKYNKIELCRNCDALWSGSPLEINPIRGLIKISKFLSHTFRL